MRSIDADALKVESQKRQEGIERYGEEQADCFYSAGRELSTEWWCVEDMIDNATTIEPVKHGKWILKKTDSPRNERGFYYVCSECGAGYRYETNFCPKCGAKMERSEE